MSCDKTNINRRSWRQSEDEIIEKINKERGIEFDKQVSFKDRIEQAGKGSTRPDGYHKGPPPVSLEIKNYKQENYSNMKKSLEKQFNDRELHLPEDALQEAHIDIKGQNVSEAVQGQITADLEAIGYGNIRFHSN